MKRKRKQFLAGIFLMALGGGLALADQIEPGTKLPSTAGIGLQGVVPSLEGKVVLVDFWASWCGPCRKAFPELNALHKEYEGKGLVVLGVNLDEKDSAMEKFLSLTPADFPVVRDARHELAKAVQPKSMPTTLLVDRKGVVRFIHNGFKGEETTAALKKEIELLLAETDKPAAKEP